MNVLQKALAANTIFSAISSILLIIFNGKTALLFGTENNTVFWVMGIALLYFASTIWYEIKKQRTKAVLWIVAQDFLWVIGSIILLLFNPFDITTIGNVIIALVATIVLLMGVYQYRALKEIKRNPEAVKSNKISQDFPR